MVENLYVQISSIKKACLASLWVESLVEPSVEKVQLKLKKKNLKSSIFSIFGVEIVHSHQKPAKFISIRHAFVNMNFFPTKP